MDNILIFQTASASTMEKLFLFLQEQNERIYLAAQSDHASTYVNQYPWLNVIDIEKNHFYDLSDHVISEIAGHSYRWIYVPISGLRAYHYGNIMKIISVLSYDALRFFNAGGQVNEIRKMSVRDEFLCRKYMEVFRKLYCMIGRR